MFLLLVEKMVDVAERADTNFKLFSTQPIITNFKEIWGGKKMTLSPPKIEYVIFMVKMPLIHTLTIHDLE